MVLYVKSYWWNNRKLSKSNKWRWRINDWVKETETEFLAQFVDAVPDFSIDDFMKKKVDDNCTWQWLGREKTPDKFFTEFADANPAFPFDELKRRVNGTLESLNNNTINIVNGTGTAIAIKDLGKADIEQYSKEQKIRIMNEKAKEEEAERLLANTAENNPESMEQKKQPPPNDDEDMVIMAVLWRACELHKSYPPRFAQLVAIWTMLMSPTVIQMKTGEGKTLVAAIQAAFHALHGKHVDVVTSSEVLAMASIKEWKPFYDLLCLTVADPYGKTCKKSECYRADIVYGDQCEFRFDHLRQIFHGLNRRGVRRFDVGIVDEADDAFIDRRNDLTHINDHNAGMEFLEPIYAHLSTILMAIHRNVEYSKERQCYYWLDQEDDTKVELGDDHEFYAFLYKFLNERIQEYRKGPPAENESNAGNEAETAGSNDQKASSPFKFPNHLDKPFVDQQISNWIHSAISAFRLKEHGDYVISSKEGRRAAMPVDWKNTGMIMENRVLSDGLQQVLQFMHGLKMSPEGLTTCYISTKKYLSSYQHISGMTGTVGGTASRDMLKNVYGLDTVVIPTFKKRQFKLLQPIFVNGKNHLKRVAKEAKKAASQNAVLIICKQIAEVKSIKKLLNGYNKGKIYVYSRSDRKEEIKVPDRDFQRGDIVIATNLGGRGTDFKLADTTLHVLLTFYHATLRTEDQALGRTSRCGNKGTARMVLNIDALIEEYGEEFQNLIQEYGEENVDLNIKSLRMARERKEQCQIDNFTMEVLPEQMLADELFELFCAAYVEMRMKNEKDIYTLKQVNEHWGFKKRQLMDEAEKKFGTERRKGMTEEKRKLDDEKIRQETLDEFNVFLKDIKEKFARLRELSVDGLHLDLFTNPCYLTRRGLQFYIKEENYRYAIWHFKRAIALDEHMSCAAHYNLAFALLRKDYDVKEQGKILQEALGHLEKAKDHIHTKISAYWTGILAYATTDPDKPETDFQSQMKTKIGLLQHLIQKIEQTIKIITQDLPNNPGHHVTVESTLFGESYKGEKKDMERGNNPPRNNPPTPPANNPPNPPGNNPPNNNPPDPPNNNPPGNNPPNNNPPDPPNNNPPGNNPPNNNPPDPPNNNPPGNNPPDPPNNNPPGNNPPNNNPPDPPNNNPPGNNPPNPPGNNPPNPPGNNPPNNNPPNNNPPDPPNNNPPGNNPPNNNPPDPPNNNPPGNNPPDPPNNNPPGNNPPNNNPPDPPNNNPPGNNPPNPPGNNPPNPPGNNPPNNNPPGNNPPDPPNNNPPGNNPPNNNPPNNNPPNNNPPGNNPPNNNPPNNNPPGNNPPNNNPPDPPNNNPPGNNPPNPPGNNPPNPPGNNPPNNNPPEPDPDNDPDGDPPDPDDDPHGNNDDELRELAEFGIPVVFNLEIKSPEKWFSWKRLILFLVGCAQVVIGAALIYYSTGFLAKQGTWLMQEGFKDIYTSLFSNLDGFTWKSWAFDKGISFVVNLVAIGLGKWANSLLAKTPKISAVGADIVVAPKKQLMEKVCTAVASAAFTAGKEFLAEGLSAKISEFIVKLFSDKLKKTVCTKILETLQKNENASKLILGYYKIGSNWFKKILNEILDTDQSEVEKYALKALRDLAKEVTKMEGLKIAENANKVIEGLVKLENGAACGNLYTYIEGLEKCKDGMGNLDTQMPLMAIKVFGYSYRLLEPIVKLPIILSFVDKICNKLTEKISTRQGEIKKELANEIRQRHLAEGQNQQPPQVAAELSDEELQRQLENDCRRRRECIHTPKCQNPFLLHSLDELAKDLTTPVVEKLTSKIAKNLVAPLVTPLIELPANFGMAKIQKKVNKMVKEEFGAKKKKSGKK